MKITFLKPQTLSLVFISLIGIMLLTSSFVYVSAQPSSCIAPPAGMIGWWPGDGNANDIQGSSSSTIHGMVLFTTGKVENAFNFSGNGSVTTSLNNLGGNGSGTIDFWIKIPSPIIPEQYIVGIYHLFDVLTSNHGQLGFAPTVNTSSGPAIASTQFIFPAGTDFHHVALVYDSSIARGTVYLDGQQVAQTAPLPSGTNLVSFGQGNLTIGDSFTGGKFFTGSIDEIELFNTALTQAQIQSIFEAGSEGKCKPQPVNQSPSCSGTYPSESEIWPPNHTMKDISINGVIDPDGDVITINVKKILQDEPTKVNPGDPAPDGEGIGKETAKVRAERLGIGDGRVYHIEFNAEDGKGGMCESEVTVSVPHNVGLHAIDSGAIFNSTLS